MTDAKTFSIRKLTVVNYGAGFYLPLIIKTNLIKITTVCLKALHFVEQIVMKGEILSNPYIKTQR